MCTKPRSSKQESSYVCLSASDQNLSNYLLPVYKIKMKGHNGRLISFNCLLDTCSSRTYVSDRISDQMGLHKELVKNVEYSVATYLGTGTKKFKEAMVTVYLPSG